MKKLLSVLLILSLVLLPVISQAEAPYAAAFTEGKTLTLEKVDLPGAQDDWMPVSISPDGRTVLWGPGVLTRDGQTIPLTINKDRGAGDPYETLEKNLMFLLNNLPGQEGINWSLMPAYLIGTVVAALSGIASIRLLHALAKKGRFGGFAYYCWVMGVLAIILTLIF